MLVAAFALQLADDAFGGSSAFLLIVAVVAGAALATAYARTRPVPELLTVLSPAPIVFLALFLLFSPVSKLVLPQDDAEAAASDVRSKTPVVFVVLDEFDTNMLMNARQRIDRTRYPNFAALASTVHLVPKRDHGGRQTTATRSRRCCHPRAATATPCRSPPTTRTASSPCWARATR